MAQVQNKTCVEETGIFEELACPPLNLVKWVKLVFNLATSAAEEWPPEAADASPGPIQTALVTRSLPSLFNSCLIPD
jgi:hypothetical protein